jgi:uncharacterized protein (DUF1778 family)
MAVTKAQVQALLDQATTKLTEFVAKDATQQAQSDALRAQIVSRSARRKQVELTVASLEQLIAAMDAPIDPDPAP